MRGTPLNHQVKGVGEVVLVDDEEEEEEEEDDQLELLGSSSSNQHLLCGGGVNKRKKVLFDSSFYFFKQGLLVEPRSVLDHRRSPSPPTSTSTLSSSLGCASSDTAGVAAVSHPPATAPAHKWPSSPPPPPPSADRREDWPSELQSIPASLVSSDKPAGLSSEDWETMLSDPAPSPGQEQTFLRWIMGDIDDPSPALKQHLVSQGPLDLDPNPNPNPILPFGLVDPSLSFDTPAINPSPPLFSAPSTSFFHSMSGGANNKVTPAPPQNHYTIKLPNYGPPPATGLPLPPGMFFQEGMDEKPQPQPQLFPPSLPQSHSPQNPVFFYPETAHQLLLPPQPKRHHPMEPLPLPKIPIPDPGGPDLFLRRNNPQAQTQPSLLQPLPYQPHRPMKPKVPAGDEQQQQQQALVDQLFKAAGLVEAGNSVGARGILARLNHQLPPSPLGKPLLRSAFYFRDALQLLLSPSPSSPSTLSNPLDVVLKLSAYMTFSEVSPVLQFTNFTSIQAILEELGGSDRIHIIDFDIGVGGQWSSFMQELAQRRCASTPSPVLKITAFVSLNSSHHPLELHLTRENLSHFARDLNIPFEFNIMSLESFDPVTILGMSQDEAIAVNLPVGSAFGASIPTILRLVKQLSPKIVVSVDQGYDRSDLPFAQHFLHALQSNMVLLDSIDAAGTSPDAASNIERFLLQPRIEAAVLGRHRTEKMPPWRTLFASAGFVPLQFSNFTETQAECLLKRVQVRGFHVEKRLASLFLYWQRGELASVSAWRC